MEIIAAFVAGALLGAGSLIAWALCAVNTMCAGLWEAWRTRFPEVPMEDMREATEVIRIRPNHRRSSRGTAFWLPGCKMRRLLLMW